MWSLLQLLSAGGSHYLVNDTTPHANARVIFKLSLVAHSCKPAC